mmetsp:Transcript_8703/g.14760  ORF Transcript_8703/g.14760 Transcript_8703/m.14760 type:complete len:404 (+) Transcript_8703:1203-2414(+)
MVGLVLVLRRGVGWRGGGGLLLALGVAATSPLLECEEGLAAVQPNDHLILEHPLGCLEESVQLVLTAQLYDFDQLDLILNLGEHVDVVQVAEVQHLEEGLVVHIALEVNHDLLVVVVLALLLTLLGLLLLLLVEQLPEHLALVEQNCHVRLDLLGDQILVVGGDNRAWMRPLLPRLVLSGSELGRVLLIVGAPEFIELMVLIRGGRRVGGLILCLLVGVDGPSEGFIHSVEVDLVKESFEGDVGVAVAPVLPVDLVEDVAGLGLDHADVVDSAAADLDHLLVHERLDQLGGQLHAIDLVVLRRVERRRVHQRLLSRIGRADLPNVAFLSLRFSPLLVRRVLVGVVGVGPAHKGLLVPVHVAELGEDDFLEAVPPPLLVVAHELAQLAAPVRAEAIEVATLCEG